jgi:hypothetical protein
VTSASRAGALRLGVAQRRRLLLGVDLHAAACRRGPVARLDEDLRHPPSTCGWMVVEFSDRTVEMNSDDISIGLS